MRNPEIWTSCRKSLILTDHSVTLVDWRIGTESRGHLACPSMPSGKLLQRPDPELR